MPTIQIIDLRGRAAAIVAGQTTIIAEHVPDELVKHVQAKALYALQITAGELPGPYTDADAERYAHTAATTARRASPPRQRGRARHGAARRRQ